MSPLMLHSCHLHGHTQRKRRVFGGESGCEARVTRPAVVWKAEKDAVGGVGPGPAAAALLSLF